MTAIKADKILKKYGEKVAVNVTLEVDEGKIFGFLGKNGAGKSTFINIITGLIKQTSGSYHLNVTDIKKNIGVLPDYSSFYDNLTGREHINYFAGILNIKVSLKEMENIFDSVGLIDGIDLKVKHYSFGMKKKLGIAQAIINKPKILFLDEPTSGVDANSILSIHKLIKEISDNGTTIFLTSHNLDEIEKLCDDIAIMDRGQILVSGNINDLKKEYQNNIILKIKHDCINAEKCELLNSYVNSDRKNIIEHTISEKESQFKLRNEKITPFILKAYFHSNIDVYEARIHEVSLEELFLNYGTEQ